MSRNTRLTRAQLRRNPELARRLARRAEPDRLRRVRIACCPGWRRDPHAAVGDWVWCEEHSDFGRVIEVAA